MKSMYLSLYILSLFPCNLVQKINTVSSSQNIEYKLNDSSSIYRILKIDTIKNIYIILAQKNELTYKIVLFKDSAKCINNFKPGQCHKLLLKSVFPENYIQRDRVSVVRYGSVQVPLERNSGMVWDLFSILNLNDLCKNLTLQSRCDTIPSVLETH